MLAGRPHIEPKLRPGADSVVVKEIYLSLQGESSHAGLLCTFIRLTGCHLRCTYCDSEFAFRGGRRMPIPDILEKVRALGSSRVEVTGGEPLLQPGVYPLMEALLDAGHTVMLETSGAIDVRLVPAAVQKIVDLKTPSSGECDRNDLRVLDSMNQNDELKFVIGTREDYEWARELFRSKGLANRPYGALFSTVFGKLHPRQLAEWIIEDRLPVRFQLQQHKYVWDPNARGV
jgi:7-carboxy-7-deazaguanine synthase